MLQEEVQKRTGASWDLLDNAASPPSGCLIAVGTPSELNEVLPEPLRKNAPAPAAKAEAFAIRTGAWQGRTTIVIAGHDARGVLFGIGMLLRKLSLSPNRAALDQPLDLRSSPQKPVRGHQLGYRAKNNTYDAWNLAQFEQQIRDLAIFGANTIQLIAPVSDDAATSPLSHAPPLETLVSISRILDRYGLNCDLFYPEMEADYSRQEDIERELQRFEALVRSMPRLDAVWIPGGDPGHTEPALLLPLVAREAEILRRYHSGARIYISEQGMDAAQADDFYRLLQQPPAWLSGVFFGPQSRDGFEIQRKRLPAKLPMLFYPDIGHTMHAQFPVPEWDPVFAQTEGREPIDPRPVDEGIIYRHFASLHEGFVTYSEGVNDDVNKMLWGQWGWDASLSAESILRDYARFFAGPEIEHNFASGIEHLEDNWRGPLAANRPIETTFREFEQMHSNPHLPRNNWRFEMAFYRACYDAYLQRRVQAERHQQAEALNVLRKDAHAAGAASIEQAEMILASPLPNSVRTLQTRLFQLGSDLFHHIGLQLSTSLYGASNWERGANLDHADIPLNDRLYLLDQLGQIRSLPAREADEAISRLLREYDPHSDAYVDDLGDPEREPHLVRGSSYADDPEMYRQAIDGVADRTPDANWTWSQLTYAEALYETPLQLRYENLDHARRYHLRVVMAGEDYALPLRLVANQSIEIQPFIARRTNPQTVEYDLPQEATRNGILLLEWFRPKGIGGSGRGRQIAEVSLSAWKGSNGN